MTSIEARPILYESDVIFNQNDEKTGEPTPQKEALDIVIDDSYKLEKIKIALSMAISDIERMVPHDKEALGVKYGSLEILHDYLDEYLEDNKDKENEVER